MIPCEEGCDAHTHVQSENSENFVAKMDKFYSSVMPLTHFESESTSEELKNETQSNEAEANNPPILLLNLTGFENGEFHCYSCGSKITRPDTPTNDCLKYLLVSQVRNEKHSCGNCGAPLFLQLNERSKDEETKEYLITKLNTVDQLLAKKYVFDGLRYTLVLRDTGKRLFYVIEREGNYYLSLRPWSALNETNALMQQFGRVRLSKMSKVADLWNAVHRKDLPEVVEGLKQIGSIPSVVSDNLGITFEGIDVSFLKGFKSLVFLDVDGTLTSNQLAKKNLTSKLSVFLLKVLMVLERKRILKVVLASGRPLEFAYHTMCDWGLQPLAICSNGNGVCYPRIDSYLERQTHFQKSQYKQLLKNVIQVLNRKYSLNLIQYLPFTNANTELMINSYYAPNIEYFQDLLNSDSIVRHMLELTGLKALTVTAAESPFLHLSCDKYSKGSASKMLLNALKFDQDRTFNVGNHHNDLSLKGVVSKTFGVANSEAQYATKCDYVSQKFEAQGTLDCVKNFLLQKKLLSEQQFDQIVSEVKSSFDVELDHFTEV